MSASPVSLDTAAAAGIRVYNSPVPVFLDTALVEGWRAQGTPSPRSMCDVCCVGFVCCVVAPLPVIRARESASARAKRLSCDRHNSTHS
jgi:hypothetical protein